MLESKSTQGFAATKLILSGEHSVVHGAPAICMRIPIYSQCNIHFQPSDHFHFTIALDNFQQSKSFDWIQLHNQSLQIKSRFLAFKQNQLSIREVCRSPFDLIIIALFQLNELTPLAKGEWQISIGSDAPVGRGLGTSASILTALTRAIKTDWSEDELFQFITQLEHYQHGSSSGIDPAAIIKAECLRMKHGCIKTLKFDQPCQLKAFLIDSGEPQSTTGECVFKVGQAFPKQDPIWQEFAKCNHQVMEALTSADNHSLCQAIQRNQSLLERIGVVPQKVADVCQTLNILPSTAVKVCGAGAVQGDRAGMLLCLSSSLQTIEKTIQAFGLKAQPIQLPFTEPPL
jgi:mevalonate kinase